MVYAKRILELGLMVAVLVREILVSIRLAIQIFLS